MDKSDFQSDVRYTIAWQPPGGRVIPATIYVYRTHDAFMIVRGGGTDGALRKMGYAEVLKMVSAEPVPPEKRRAVPAALLNEKIWRDRTTMAHYSSSPTLGK
jgi:hypothetical protein